MGTSWDIVTVCKFYPWFAKSINLITVAAVLLLLLAIPATAIVKTSFTTSIEMKALPCVKGLADWVHIILLLAAVSLSTYSFLEFFLYERPALLVMVGAYAQDEGMKDFFRQQLMDYTLYTVFAVSSVLLSRVVWKRLFKKLAVKDASA